CRGVGARARPPRAGLYVRGGWPRAGRGAGGGVRVPADLQLQQLKGGPVAGLEQVVQDLGELRRRVVLQIPRVAAAAEDGAKAVVHPAAAVAVDRDGGGRQRRPVRGTGGGVGPWNQHGRSDDGAPSLTE